MVAGSSYEYVQSSQRLDATVVLMAPNLDVAVLRVPQLSAPSLRLDTADCRGEAMAPCSAIRVGGRCT